MSKKTLYLLGILLTILIGTYLNWKFCCNPSEAGAGDELDRIVNKEDANSKQVVATSKAFQLHDEAGNFDFSSDSNFDFETSSFSLITPVSDDLNKGIDGLQAYLDLNKSKSVDIFGLYTSKEENTSAFPNLGMARANAIKNYFTSKGILSSQVNLFGKLDDSLVPNGNLFKGPATFEISTSDDSSANEAEAEIQALGDKIRANPLVLNFARAQTQINLTAEQRQKIADIVRYLDKTEGAKALVTGHTDNTSSRTSNIRLGQKRANFAKNYLMQNGISETQIIASSKGPDEPIASNASEEGRSKNRRTVVTIN